ncbi:MAG TPA: hypothetical protein VEA99_13025, partial [Gemmatimonadaceae bacterium]|nr:hypothetical protein [Gemmatimonadaceae bacterium]
MAAYRVFGGVLRSELSFPSLPVATGARADWTLTLRPELPAMPGAVPLGEEPLVEGVCARLTRGAERYRLVFDDTGCYDVSLDGREIVWCPRVDASEDLARLDVIGRVLALASHAAGMHCLHASAAVIDGRAVAFLAPKGFGKSTLALALLRQGARLLTDDTLPVTPGAVVTAHPGVHGIRLRDDVAARFASDQPTAPTMDADKLLLSGLAE